MGPKFISSKYRVVLLLLLMPFIVGSQCVVLFSSGDGSNDKDEDKEGLVVISSSGVFGATPVAGVDYSSGEIRGVTGKNGEFEYELNSPVQFAIGDIALGSPVAGKSLITTADLAADTPAAVNIQRLLLSLDADPEDGLITIPEEVRSLALRSNDSVSASIEFLDFSDEPAFINAASQLVAVLTQNYPFTAVLRDADTAGSKTAKSQ
jgi:hypothetical protein